MENQHDSKEGVRNCKKKQLKNNVEEGRNKIQFDHLKEQKQEDKQKKQQNENEITKISQ